MEVMLKIIRGLSPNTIELGVRNKDSQIDKIVSFIEGQGVTRIVGKKGDRNQYIPLDICVSFYANQKKVYVSTADQNTFLVNNRLYELAENLPRNFVRISNTEIVNLNFVSEFQLSKSGIIIIYFKDGTQTSSSRRYLKRVKERLI